MYLLIVFLPFLNFLFLSLLGRFFNFTFLFIFNLYNNLILIFCVFFIFYEIILCNTICYINLSNWIILNELNINWNFLFDNLSVSMLIIITFISFLVQIYSFEYMSNDPHLNRFISYLSLFTFFMIILVTAGNFLQLFLGWEGVGLASYLLINFWYTRINANKSAIKAVILNRIGDLSLFIAFGLIIYNFKTLNYLELILLTNFFYENYQMDYNIICIFLLIGAIGKSAQLGLHIWLPDAMEGPTPVSALIHAATMVTAGIFLLIRSSFFIEYSNNISIIITIIGGLTAFFAATIGLFQNDIKRIIAYSTCSQLGYMLFACGFHYYDVGFFHLFNHAFFKALLFLSAGAIIHSLNDEQDIRKMGSLFKLLPISYISFLIGSLSLTGFPFLTGFYSKDFLLELTLTNYENYNLFIYWLGTISAMFTAFYSFRLIFYVFFKKTQNYKKIYTNIKENNILINLVLIILNICSIFIGYFFKDLIIGIGSIFWSNILIFNSKYNNIYNAEFLDVFYKNIPFFLSLISFFLCFFIYNKYINKILFKIFINYNIIRNIYFFFNKRWFFDLIYNYYFGNFFFKKFFFFFKDIDRGLLEIIGSLGFIRLFYKLSKNYLNFYQNGSISFYFKLYLLFILLFFFNLYLFLDFYINIYNLFFFIYIFFSLNFINYLKKNDL
jgi:NADH-ubiquinone oxidoreductase chain 5